jgi:uncharacterized membrane protein YgaE (UPF0421/DUF939 family)
MVEFPPIGMRIIKTSVSVMACLLLGHLFHYPTPLFACMAAVIVTRENFETSFQQSIARILATIVGCLFALIIMQGEFKNEYVHILITGAGCVLTIYFCVLIKHPDAAALSAIIFLSLALTHIDDKYVFTFIRLTETIAGIIVSLLVNLLLKKKM